MIRRQNILLLLVLAIGGCGRAATPTATSPSEDTAISVNIVIESDDGSTKSFALDDLPADSTVADAMRTVDNLDVQIQGEGTMTFVESIDGQQTSGGEGWLYFINDQWAKAGIGTQSLSDGDVVRWSYGSFDAH